MTQYNLIRNGLINTLTVSGTGNKSLSNTELNKLYDNNTTSSGVVLTTTDEVFIDIDLSNRIRVNEFSLYFDVTGDRATALSKIYFYYKDSNIDSYTLLDKVDTTTKFLADNLPTLFAPRYIRIVIDKVEGNLYELVVYNDDYDIAFGDSGQTSLLQMDEFSEYSTLAIYNNADEDTPSVTAYISVDFQNNYLDYYLKLATSSDGNYKGINDGIGLNDECKTNYEWKMGKFYNTTYVDNKVVLHPVSYINNNIYDTFYTNEYVYYRTDLPIIEQILDSGWGVAQNCWDWSDTNDVYALGRVSETSQLYLYKYDDVENDWLTISTLGGVIGDNMACMVCMEHYIYVLIDSEGSFGRCDLNGTLNNWESLDTCPHGIIADKFGQGMCSDKNRYIYSAFTTDATTVAEFDRFDTVSGTWTAMDNGYNINNHTSSYPDLVRSALAYDIENECVYLDCGELSAGINSIQRYVVSTDSWQTSWYAQSIDSSGRGFSYYGGYLATSSLALSKAVQVYNIYTMELILLELPYTPNNGIPPQMLCFPDSDGNGGVKLAITRINSNEVIESIYFYNLGRDFNKPMTGYYITPIMSVEDPHSSSYLHVDYTTSSGNSISYYSSSFGPASTVLIKSSNETPKAYTKVFHAQRDVLNRFFLMECDLMTGSIDKTSDQLSCDYDADYTIYRILFDKYNKSLVIFIRRDDDYGVFLIYDLKLKQIVETSIISSNYAPLGMNHLSLDVVGNIWFYYNTQLFKMPHQLNTPDVVITSNGADFIHTISANLIYEACWYTDTASKNVINIDSNGDEVCSMALSSPTAVCSSIDGGCFVFDDGTNKIYKLSYDGTELFNFNISSAYPVTIIASDFKAAGEQYLWVLVSNSRILRIDINGNILSETIVPLATSLIGFIDGCLVNSSTLNIAYQLNSNGDIEKAWNLGGVTSSAHVSCPIILTYKELLDNDMNFLHDEVIDPTWGESVDSWRELNIDENILPAKKYHQVKFRLYSDAGVTSPEIKKVIIPEPLKLIDLHPKSSKNIYLKTDFPVDAVNDEYETKLRCWWGK